jgi:hypothetical protein
VRANGSGRSPPRVQRRPLKSLLTLRAHFINCCSSNGRLPRHDISHNTTCDDEGCGDCSSASVAHHSALPTKRIQRPRREARDVPRVQLAQHAVDDELRT